ncbi:hypothetical protein [Ammoniphilus sp. CFH 90114]|nr:hypothetical protein [Ammoniphilus sp. CFH 90114]
MKLNDKMKALLEEYGEEDVISALLREVKKASITVTYEDLDAVYSGWTKE